MNKTLVLRDNATVDRDASFELGELWVLAVSLSKATDLGSLPAVNGYMKRDSGLETRYEARHDGQTVCPVRVRELGVGDNMARDFELLDRDLGLATRGEEKDIPVFVAHLGARTWRAVA